MARRSEAPEAAASSRSGVDVRSGGYAAVLRIPGVSRLLVAALLGRTAEGMVSLAIVLHVLARSGSPGLAGIAVFCSIAPGLIGSPVAGAVLDRVGGVRAMRVDFAISVGALAGIAALGAFDVLPDLVLLALIATYSLTSPLSLAGIRALLPQVVPASSLDEANALDTAIWAVVGIVAPVAAAACFAVAGGNLTFAFIAALYGGAWLAIAPVRTARGVTEGQRSVRALVGDAGESVVYVLKHSTLRALALTYSLYQAAWGILVVILPVVVGSFVADPDAAVQAVGALWALAAAAGGMTAVVAGRVGTRSKERLILASGTLVSGAGLATVAVVYSAAWLLIAVAILGLASGPIDMALLRLRQRRTDPSRLGRVLAVSISLNGAGAPVGSAIGGLVAGVSPNIALAVAAFFACLAAAAAMLIPSERTGGHSGTSALSSGR